MIKIDNNLISRLSKVTPIITVLRTAHNLKFMNCLFLEFLM